MAGVVIGQYVLTLIDRTFAGVSVAELRCRFGNDLFLDYQDGSRSKPIPVSLRELEDIGHVPLQIRYSSKVENANAPL